jgi:maltooligosyltrehalose trehalohydrolase
MGEEWGAREPFPFFCDFHGELAEAVRKGRRREFAEAYAAHGDDIPDPLSADTRSSAVLDWDARAKPPHTARLTLTRALLAARRKWIAPLVPEMLTPGNVRWQSGMLAADWPAGGKHLLLVANLSDSAQPKPSIAWGEPIWGGTPRDTIPPWSVHAAIGGP